MSVSDKTEASLEGITVYVYRSTIDNVLVVDIQGAPDDDDDCQELRVLLNEAYASEWTGCENENDTCPGKGYDKEINT